MRSLRAVSSDTSAGRVSWTGGQQPIHLFMSMTVSSLCKKRMVQFGDDTVHFVHLSETMGDRSRLVYSPVLEEVWYDRFWGMCEYS
jgi:hypothetical protein